MITLTNLSDPTLHEFSLTPEPRQTRRGKAPTKLRGAVDLGEVVPVPLVPSLASDDAVLKHFLETEALRYRFHLLRLACGFRPGQGEKFDRAWLTVDLRREDGAAIDRPIAWSMAPKREVKQVEVTTKVSLGSKLQLLETELGGEEKYSREEVFLEAYGQQQPRSMWEFKTTSKVDLQGSYLLHLVVRSPTSVVTCGDVSLSVAVKQTKYLLLEVSGKLEAHPALLFRLT